MTFEEWFKSEQQHYGRYALDNSRGLLQGAWHAAQEAMRERAVNAAAPEEMAPKHFEDPLTNQWWSGRKDAADAIRALPVE